MANAARALELLAQPFACGSPVTARMRCRRSKVELFYLNCLIKFQANRLVWLDAEHAQRVNLKWAEIRWDKIFDGRRQLGLNVVKPE